MAFENITVAVGDLVVGFVMLIIGCIMIAVNKELPRPWHLILIIGGAILAIVGMIVVILAFI